MSRNLWRGMALAGLGATIGAVCLVAAYVFRPPVDLDMDRDLPSVAIGLYSVERAGELTFAWTSERADFTLRDLDRTTAWTCTFRILGDRPGPALPRPAVRIAVDGAVATEASAEARPMDVVVPVPRRKTSGLRMTLWTIPTFVPSRSDPRALGVVLDRLSCRPERSFAWPPQRTTAAAALAMGAMAAGFALMGIAMGHALALVGTVSAAQAWAVTIGTGPYSPYVGTVGWLAAWILSATVALVKLWEWSLRRSLDGTSRLAVGVAAGFMYLKLLALLHPSKDLVDALFHAHRLESVLAGQFYFTQLSTSATPFPYAIGLYVFAAPWAWLTSDHVTLLRVVVCAIDAVAALSLFAVIVRTREDRLTGLLAVVFVSLVPLSYTILGHANLTSAFGNSVSVASVAIAGLWAGRGHRWPVFGILTLVAALAFISHISTLTLLFTTLVLVGVLYWLMGGPSLRPAAHTVLVTTLSALALAVALYWGHFGPVYVEQLQRVRLAATASAVGEADAGSESASGTVAGLGNRTLPLVERLRAAEAQTVSNLGWPLLALGAIGLARLCAARGRDRLVLAVVAWGLTAAAFMAAAVLGPGNAAYQQDAWEFIGRIEHATHPAVVVLAAMGAAWTWRCGGLARLVSGMLLCAAVATGARAWALWLLPS